MTGGRTPDVDLDRALDALRTARRRHLLARLLDAPPDAELAVPGLAPDGVDPESFTTRFHHADAPKLTEPGYVTYDDDALTVERGPNFEVVASLLELLREHREELSAERC